MKFIRTRLLCIGISSLLCGCMGPDIFNTVNETDTRDWYVDSKGVIYKIHRGETK